MRPPRWGVVLLALSGACADPESTPAPLEIGPATDSWFAAERLPLPPAEYGCVGVIEVRGQEWIVTATAQAVTLLRPGAAGWVTATVEFEADLLSERVFCTAAELDGIPGPELVVVDGHGGLLVSLTQPEPTIRALPEFPRDWADDPLPLHDTIAGALGLIDVNGDGRLDVYVARTQSGAADLFVIDGCETAPSGDVQCGDGSEYLGAPDLLLLNRGAGEFTISAALPSLNLQGQCVGALDLDDDGRQELITCNDAAYNHVLSASGDGVWRDRTQEWGLDILNHGMGFAAGDLDGNGVIDLVFSDLGTPLVLFGRKSGGWTLGSQEQGFAAVAQNAWGVVAEDLDNDGDLDLLFENDLLEFGDFDSTLCGEGCEVPPTDPPELLLYRNQGAGRFAAEQPVTGDAGLAEAKTGGDALAVADVDKDGLLDALIIRTVDYKHRELWLLRGRAGARTPKPRHFIEVRAPFGARVRVCSNSLGCRAREVLPASSHRAVASPWLHFGLGRDTQAEVAVEWPPGTVTELGSYAARARVRFPPPTTEQDAF